MHMERCRWVFVTGLVLPLSDQPHTDARWTRLLLGALARIRRTARDPWRISAADVGASALCSILLNMAYVGPMVPELAFVAPVGFVACLAGAGVAGGAALGALFGLVLALVGLGWVSKVTVLGLMGLMAFFAVLFAVFGGATAWIYRHSRLPLSVIVPVLWVVAEYARANLFTGFPWLLLGHALSDRLAFIQVADIGGAYAVSFTAALVGAALGDLALYLFGREHARSRRVCVASVAVAGGVVALQLAYGVWRLHSTRFEDGPRLVLIQGNIYTPRGAGSDEAHVALAEEIWRSHEALSRESASEGDLLVWSESMIPNYYNDSHDTEGVRWHGRLAGLLAEVDRELLTGSNSTGPHPASPEGLADPASSAGEYNSAIIIDSRSEIQGRYDKMHLVPFGEYVPLSRWPVLSGLTPYAADDLGYRHGFPDQPLLSWRKYRFGILICYEDAFAYLARRARRRGADFLVNLSSEAWFAGTSEIRQHQRLSRFRAVENRIALVRCCNVGVTGVVDPAGRFLQMLSGSDTDAGARGALAVGVPLNAETAMPVYARWGDAFAHVCAACAFVMLAWTWRSARARNHESATVGEHIRR
jgi:apolipoprotein N-acyltransferase